MEEVKVFYDKIGNTLTVWFGNPKDEYICEETGDEVILMKDKSGNVIGFGKLKSVLCCGSFFYDTDRLQPCRMYLKKLRDRTQLKISGALRIAENRVRIAPAKRSGITGKNIVFSDSDRKILMLTPAEDCRRFSENRESRIICLRIRLKSLTDIYRNRLQQQLY